MFNARTKLTATGTEMRGVSWVNKDSQYSSFQSLVSNKGLELSERPGVMEIPLFFSDRGVFSDVRQFLHSNRIPFFEAINYSPADGVVNLCYNSFLLARKPYQGLFSTFRTFSLERRTDLLKMFSDMFCLFAGKLKAVGSRSNVVNAQVYSNRIRSSWRNNFLFQNETDVKDLFGLLIKQSCGFWILTSKDSPMVIAQRKFKFQASVDGGKRNRLLSFNEPKGANIEVKGTSLKRFWSFLPFLCNSGNSTNHKISLKMVSILNQVVGKVVQAILVKIFLFSGYRQNIVTGLGKSIDGLQKRFSFCLINLQPAFNRFYKFHVKNYITNKLVCQMALLPAINDRVSGSR